MVHLSHIQARINQLGVRVSYWYKPELKELAMLLMDDEQIVSLVTGRYYGGYAMLVATERRLLLIDKKTLFLSLEDIRFDMISEIDYSNRLLDATITIFTVNKQHRFTSIKHRHHMRQLTAFVQQRIMEIRQPQDAQQLVREMEDQGEAVPQPAQSDFSAQIMPQYSHSLSPRSVSGHLRTVGTAAIRGAHMSVINPYTSSSLSVRRNWSGFHQYHSR